MDLYSLEGRRLWVLNVKLHLLLNARNINTELADGIFVVVEAYHDRWEAIVIHGRAQRSNMILWACWVAKWVFMLCCSCNETHNSCSLDSVTSLRICFSSSPESVCILNTVFTSNYSKIAYTLSLISFCNCWGRPLSVLWRPAHFQVHTYSLLFLWSQNLQGF